MRNWVMWVALLGSPAVAQEPCNIAASARVAPFTKVPVHAAPSSTSEVLEIAPEFDDGGTMRGARLQIMAVQNGFAQATVTDWSRTVPPFEGWISIRNVQVSPQTNRGFAVASASSRVVWEGTEWPAAEGLVECKGEWGKVTIRDAASSVAAWVRGFCDDQAAACDGVTGD